MEYSGNNNNNNSNNNNYNRSNDVAALLLTYSCFYSLSSLTTARAEKNFCDYDDTEKRTMIC